MYHNGQEDRKTKTRRHAKDTHEELAKQRKGQWSQGKADSRPAASPVRIPSRTPERNPAPVKAVSPAKTPEEEAREFLDYLEKESFRIIKDDSGESVRRKKIRKQAVAVVNLENGMPTVEEALTEMRHSLQSMRHSGIRFVKLIHGYGSTGRGGKICIAVRNELAAMVRKRLIRDFVAGEDFGPYSDSARRMADLDREVTRDPDYGKCNHGITIVAL